MFCGIVTLLPNILWNGNFVKIGTTLYTFYISGELHFMDPTIFAALCSPFTTLDLGSIRMDRVISEACYKETISQRIYNDHGMEWSITYNSL